MATTVPDKPKARTMQERIKELKDKRATIEKGGGQKRIDKQH